MKPSKIYFEIAKKDLEAAKCLYEKGLYPQTVFYLQQSVEKAAKSFALMMNKISESQAKEFKHNTLKIHEKLLNEQMETLERLNETSRVIPRLKETSLLKDIDFNGVCGVLDRSQNSISTIQAERRFLSKQEIMQLIGDLNTLEKDVAIAFDSGPDQEFTDKLRQGLLELLDVLHEYSPQKVEELKKEVSALSPNFLWGILEKIKPRLIDLYYVVPSLLYLSIITFPHAVTSRYLEAGVNPLETYKKDFPLIELFGECVEVVEKTLVKIENLENLPDKLGELKPPPAPE